MLTRRLARADCRQACRLSDDGGIMNAPTSASGSKSLIARTTAMRFIIMLGVVSLFADMTYEGVASLGISSGILARAA